MAKGYGLAGQIDGYLKQKGSPLSGLGNVFVASGKKYGIDPRLIVGIAGAESSFGTRLLSPNNAWNWNPGKPFSSWQEGISTVTQGMAYYRDHRHATTPAQIVTHYAPSSDGNDEAQWTSNVSTFMRELGASPTMTPTKTVVTPTPPPAAKGVPTSAVSAPSPVPAALAPVTQAFQLPTIEPSTFGLRNALISGLMGANGSGSGTNLLQSVVQGQMQDQATNTANQAQLDAYTAALKAMAPPPAAPVSTPVATPSTPPAGAAPTPTPPPTTAATDTPASPGKTVWPYASDVYRGRTDQGVDWIQSSPYLAPRSGTIAAIDPTWYKSNAGNWTPAIYLKFDQPVTVNGRKYPGVFFAETSVIPGMKEGDRVEAGQPIAGGSPGSSLAEQGFAAPIGGSWRQAAYGHYSEGQATQAGQDFADWLSNIRKA